MYAIITARLLVCYMYKGALIVVCIISGIPDSKGRIVNVLQ